MQPFLQVWAPQALYWVGLHAVFKKLPKWLVPAGAGLGMLLFQIYSEYTWYGHTRSLPAETVVVAEIAETAPYKPWSYLKPQVLRFVAVDTAKLLDAGGGKVQANLYFFERRMSANTWPVWIDCEKRLQANVTGTKNGVPSAGKWGKTEYTEKIAGAVCGKAAAGAAS